MSSPRLRNDLAAHALALPVFRWFGVELEELSDGRCVARLPWREELSHTAGAFQANPIAALADFAGVLAGLSALPSGSTATTVDYTAKFLAEARGTELIARARLIARGNSISVSQVDVSVLADDAERHCATALVTIRNRAPQAPGRKP